MILKVELFWVTKFQKVVMKTHNQSWEWRRRGLEVKNIRNPEARMLGINIDVKVTKDVDARVWI